MVFTSTTPRVILTSQSQTKEHAFPTESKKRAMQITCIKTGLKNSTCIQHHMITATLRHLMRFRYGHVETLIDNHSTHKKLSGCGQPQACQDDICSKLEEVHRTEEAGTSRGQCRSTNLQKRHLNQESLSIVLIALHCKESLLAVASALHCKESLRGVASTLHCKACWLQEAECFQTNSHRHWQAWISRN